MFLTARLALALALAIGLVAGGLTLSVRRSPGPLPLGGPAAPSGAVVPAPEPLHQPFEHARAVLLRAPYEAIRDRCVRAMTQADRGRSQPAQLRQWLESSGLSELSSQSVDLGRSWDQAQFQVYDALFWRLCVERLAEKLPSSRSSVQNLFPVSLSPGLAPPAGRRWVSSLRASRGLHAGTFMQWLASDAGQGKTTPGKERWTLALEGVGTARSAWVALRTSAPPPGTYVELSVNDRIVVHLLPLEASDAPELSLTHTLPIWVFREGENRFQVRLREFVRTGTAQIDRLFDFAVVLVP